MAVQIEGKIIPGLGAAKAVLPLQLPWFIGRFPQLGECHPATINVQLDQPLRIDRPDFWIPAVQWHPNQIAETFGFVEVWFVLPLNKARRRAWMYMPSHSPHLHNEYQVELLCKLIEPPDAVAYGTRCSLRIDRPTVPLVLTRVIPQHVAIAGRQRQPTNQQPANTKGTKTGAARGAGRRRRG